MKSILIICLCLLSTSFGQLTNPLSSLLSAINSASGYLGLGWSATEELTTTTTPAPVPVVEPEVTKTSMWIVGGK